MNRDEFIGKLQMCCFGDRNAFNEIVNEYDKLKLLYDKALSNLVKDDHKIIKAIEYLTSYESINTIQQNETPKNNENLDEKTMIEITRRYMIVHDKMLNILNGENND